ncbi:hypothetical protein PGB90_007805 [Kerria lacca]
MFSRRTLNILMLSIGFMLLFISFQTMANIMITILHSVQVDDKNYDGDAKISLAIIYVVLAVSNFLAPSIVNKFGTRLSMVIGAVTYSIFIASFLLPITYVLYIVSVLLGIGGAIIWTAQGTYLTQNSDNLTISRNSGIFWAIFQCSQLFGNLFVFFAFEGKKHIDLETRTYVYTTLTVISIVGILLLLLLRPAVTSQGEEITEINVGAILAIRRVFGLFTEGKMLLLCISFCKTCGGYVELVVATHICKIGIKVFANNGVRDITESAPEEKVFSLLYTGALLSFAGSIYNPCIGFTMQFGDNRKSLVGLGGILFGVGEVFGGTVFGWLGPKSVIWGRNPIIFMGCFNFLVCFALIFLNIPDSSAYGDTNDVSFFSPPIWWLAVLCSFLLGFGDSCFNTQIYSIIGTIWREDSTSPFAMFKFIQSVSSGLAFIYFKYLGLNTLIIILSVTVVLASVTFIFVERIAVKLNRELDKNVLSTATDRSFVGMHVE